MKYEFFVDLFFFADLIFNVLSLIFAGLLLRRHAAWSHIFLAAAVGSLWNCLLILFPIFPRFPELFVTAFGAGSLMCFLAFGFRTVPELLKGNISLLTASALIVGIMDFLRENFRLSDWEAMTLLGITCFGGGCFFRQLMQERAIGAERYHVKLYYQGACRDFLALADSGNRLHVPGTGKPVSLAAYEDCKGFCDRVSAGFYIPYRAVGTDQGLLFAVVLEKMEIMKDGRTIIVENPVVAVSKERLCTDASFSMLLPEEYIRK